MKNIWILLFAIFIIAGCQKDDNTDPDNPDQGIDVMEDLQVSDNFDYNTVNDINFNIRAINNQGNAIPNATIKVMDKPAYEGGNVLLSGATDSDGVFRSTYPVPSYYENVYVVSDYIGITSELKVELNGSEQVDVVLGGTQSITKMAGQYMAPKAADFEYPITFQGNYTSNGVPEYLVEDDDVTQDFLDDINATLPERDPLFESHPEYLDPNNEHDLRINELSEAWITFVHEGAGFRNVLGYYVYDQDNPPQSPSDLDSVSIIFPNVSYQGSGGGLNSGNTVRLGIFEEDQAIGFVLFADGWENQQVTEGEKTFYSNPGFNPESNADIRQHTVLINDPYRERFVLAFEDLARDNTGTYPTDDDFNDAVFYATVTPYEAVDSDDLPIMDTDDEDLDDDQIPDTRDDFPNDPERAFLNSYQGSLAYEDLWPGKGDYDFNDIVIDYELDQITNASNKVKEIKGDFILKAHGAEYHNGFGFEMNVDPANIESVAGTAISENYISLAGNGLEAGQENATVIVFDDAYNILKYPGAGIGVNTDPDFTYVEPDTISISVTFGTPVAISSVKTPPYNPFIIADMQRGYEIHLADKAPTSLADPNLLGNWEDDSNPAQDRYFKTEGNLPWGIHIAEPFDYPVEKVQIIDAHLKFAEWAQSSGTVFTDWYKDEAGYRNDNNIYSIPE